MDCVLDDPIDYEDVCSGESLHKTEVGVECPTIEIHEGEECSEASASTSCSSGKNKKMQLIDGGVASGNKESADLLLSQKDVVRPSDYVVVLKQIKERQNVKLSDDGHEYVVIEEQLRQQEEFMKDVEKCAKGANERFPCSQCEMDFKNMGTLRRHLRNHSGFKPYQCASCNKGFTTKYSVVVHFRKHSGETPYECEICERKFNQLGSLSLHKRTHSGETPYECGECGKKFKQQTNLHTHLTAHAGDKLFECAVCSRAFAYKSILTKHMRIHTGEKPYSCLVCGQRFRNRSNLNRHISLHTDTRPHVCTLCGKKYIQLCDLAKHYESHSDAKNYPCRLCERKYALMATLRRHMQTKHSDVDFSRLAESAHILRNTFQTFVENNENHAKRARKQITPRKNSELRLDNNQIVCNLTDDDNDDDDTKTLNERLKNKAKLN